MGENPEVISGLPCCFFLRGTLPCSPDFLNWALHIWGSTKIKLLQSAVFVTTHDLRLPHNILRRGKGKHMIWRDEHKDAFVSHLLENETVLQYFRNSIRNQEHQFCYKHLLDLIMLAAGATGMTARQTSRRMQLGLPMAPWYDATCHDYKRRIRRNKKHNQPFAELQHQ